MPPSVPPGHDEADSLRLLRRKMAPEQQAQRKRGVATRKVVDETISLRLRQHGNDAFGVDAPRANRSFDTADVVWRGRGDAMDEGAACHGNLIADAWVRGGSRAIKRTAIMRAQCGAQFGHGGADVGRRFG
jgi:hypothetical protein